MPPDPRFLLADIDRAGGDIERFTQGVDSGAYADDTLTQAAVERKFEIIGEALNRLRNSYPRIAERTPRHRRIIDFRNPVDPRLFERGARTRLGPRHKTTCRNHAG